MVPFLVTKRNIENTTLTFIFLLNIGKYQSYIYKDQLKLFECNMRKAKLWGGLIFRVGKDLVEATDNQLVR